ncbi:hypothetical protein AMTRI_Chr02g259290 [Amborella trichopoda]
MSVAHQLFHEILERDVVLWTTMVNGYAKSGDLSAARQMFDKMPERSDVSWGVMISACVRSEKYKDALELFSIMQNALVKPNELALVCSLSACSNLGAFDQGKWIHIYIKKSGTPLTYSLGTTVIDMYSKCGSIDNALKVFNRIMHGKDLMAWTSMISGLAMHGNGLEAIELFNRMLREGIKPDSIAFIGVLNACTHSGLVNEGRRIFQEMRCYSWDQALWVHD